MGLVAEEENSGWEVYTLNVVTATATWTQGSGTIEKWDGDRI